MKFYMVVRPLESGGEVPVTLYAHGAGYSTRGPRNAIKFADSESAHRFLNWVEQASGIQIYEGQKDDLKVVSGGTE